MIETDMKQTYRFEDLGGLRDRLNQFTTIDLTTVRPNRGLNFVLDWYERPLGDGSTVYNAYFNTPDLAGREIAGPVPPVR